jgi:hypothetical protein
MMFILYQPVLPDQPCSVARSRMVYANRDEAATERGDSPFSGRLPPQPFPTNSLPLPNVLLPGKDRSDTIPK